MLYNIKIETYGSAFKALTDEQYASLREVMPNIAPTKAEFKSWETYCIDHHAMKVLANLKLSVEFREVTDSPQLMWVKLQDRIAALELRGQEASQIIQGAAVHIHIPDLALMAITEVLLLEDCCTDALQAELDEGWRILAICPPNAKRRPDYILGRSKGKS